MQNRADPGREVTDARLCKPPAFEPTTDPQAAEEFVRDDPFVLNGVIRACQLREWNETLDDRGGSGNQGRHP